MSLPGEFVLVIPFLHAELADAQIVEQTIAASAGRKVTVTRAECVTGFAPVTTGSCGSTLTVSINGVVVTGGAMVTTSANQTPAGKVNAATAITAANTASGSCTVGVTVSGTTTYSEGQGFVFIYYTVQ